jgi:hypothetical protein
VTVNFPQYPEDPLHVGPVSEVINSYNEYAVYVDDRERIRYLTAPWHELEDPSGFNAQWNRVAKLQFIVDQLESAHSQDHLTSLRDMIGHAVGIGLENDVEGMTAGLQEAEELLVGMAKRNAKRVYVATAKRVGLVSMVFSVLVLASGHLVAAPAKVEEWVGVVAIGVLGGSAGALLSILTSTKKEAPFDPLSSADYARFEARTRLLVGALSGTLIAIANKTGVISSSVTSVEPPEAGMLLLAVLAGFVERLVPNLLASQASKFEDGAKDSGGAGKGGAAEAGEAPPEAAKTPPEAAKAPPEAAKTPETAPDEGKGVSEGSDSEGKAQGPSDDETKKA